MNTLEIIYEGKILIIIMKHDIIIKKILLNIIDFSRFQTNLTTLVKCKKYLFKKTELQRKI